MRYQITKAECRKRIQGVCEGCGGHLEPIKTVNNANEPTYWVGCLDCSCFRGGIEKKYFVVARKLVESGEFAPYDSMSKHDYEDSEEKLKYYYDSQTASASWLVRRIDILLRYD
ncbi:hypothetical protein LCGC14_2860680 [marine sediment metagenome]|uniref:Uncharacterized protein n=1 Tax=marine sediment metagenome TaxID=412755 RepID=A0A0F9AWV0_9ZZZZ